ncbi:MAG: peptide MFS transporter [Alphaproteobacteria bacterium]|nr:peptide MFS transporter [Alphaproteobacteria bacterium]
MTAAEIDAGEGATRFGHPRGLFTVAGTEFWDRVSFHGMQALLVLYMVEYLLLPGHIEHIAGFATLRASIESVTGPLSVQALASQIFGLYVGFVYLMPVFGGFLGDVVLGRTRAVALGALLMTAGHFCMAFEQSFLPALLLLILGAGTLRGNLAPQLGDLYAKDDRRRGVAFQLYGSAVNLGAFVAPLATGQLQQSLGWHIAFGFAGVGMLAGLVFYLLGSRNLPAERVRGEDALHGRGAPRAPLTAHDKRAIVYLTAMVPVASTFWIAQSQVWNTYNLWVRDHVRLSYGGWTMPVPWLQSIDGLSPFLCLPLVLMLWRRQASRGREPGDVTKIAIGCFLFGVSTLWLSAAQYVAGADGRAPLAWAIVFHLASNIGWLFFSPTITGLFSRVAPAQVNATMMGVYYLAIFLGSTVSGRLGGLYEVVTPATFWAIHAAIAVGGGAAMLVLGRLMRGTVAAA